MIGEKVVGDYCVRRIIDWEDWRRNCVNLNIIDNGAANKSYASARSWSRARTNDDDQLRATRGTP